MSGLYFNNSNKNDVGLFGYVGAESKTGTIKNVGGAVGVNKGGTVSSVYYDKDMPCTNCSDVAGVSGKYSAELASDGFVGVAFSNASAVWSAGTFLNNSGNLSFKVRISRASV